MVDVVALVLIIDTIISILAIVVGIFLLTQRPCEISVAACCQLLFC